MTASPARSGTVGPTASSAAPDDQRWAYPLVMTLLAVALGVSGAPAPLYGVYEREWDLAPLTTTVVFAVYAVAALGAVLVAGQVSDVVGRRPLLIGAAVAMIVGLVVFMTAQGVASLLLARAIHGAAVGTTVVAGSAALLDLRPHDGTRSGHLTGIVFNLGMAVTILGASVLAQYGPHPTVTPYAVVAVVVVVLLLGVLAMAEPHAARPARGSVRVRLTRPAVPAEIAADFRFAVLGVVAAWSVLGVYLSLFPSFAGERTGIRSLVFGGAVVAAMAGAAALSQAVGGRWTPRRAAIAGDVGTAVALGLSVAALDSREPALVLGAGVLMGLCFGLGFGGSLRHLGAVVPAGHRGEVMSAYYLLAYTGLAVPTVLAGAAATTWGLAATFPWFSLAVGLMCLTAGLLGLRARDAVPAVPVIPEG